MGTKKQQAEADRADALASLRKMLKPGTVVYCTLRHVSRSGMYRSISLHYVDPKPSSPEYALVSLDWYVERIGHGKRDKHGGIGVGGAGMDMGFSLVYNLGSAIWPDGTPRPHGRRNGEADSAGGYALKSRWI